MKKIIHKIAHLLGWNEGRIVSATMDEKVVIGFRCDFCGEVSGVHTVNPELLS